jgi:hypothetical protein
VAVSLAPALHLGPWNLVVCSLQLHSGLAATQARVRQPDGGAGGTLEQVRCLQGPLLLCHQASVNLPVSTLQTHSAITNALQPLRAT